jgi:hypothetical protein
VTIRARLDAVRAADTSLDAVRAADTSTLLRAGVLALVAFGIVGTTVELVFLRHWSTATESIVWPVLLALVAAFGALILRPSRRVVQVVRVVAVVAAAFALIGIGFHVVENLDAGSLDRLYAARWDTMPAIEQWFDAITGAVGPAPTLAPGVLAEMGLGLLLATVRHPALESAAARERLPAVEASEAIG